jgi:hypothetical protein
MSEEERARKPYPKCTDVYGVGDRFYAAYKAREHEAEQIRHDKILAYLFAGGSITEYAPMWAKGSNTFSPDPRKVYIPLNSEGDDDDNA